MATQSRTTLKSYFNVGDRPTENQFGDFIDSGLHRTEDLATTAEIQAGTNNTKFVTPAGAKASVLKFAPNASVAVKGLIQVASTAEAQLGVDNSKAVTPAGAKMAVETFAPTATESVKGQIEIATIAEVQAGTDAVRAVTPAGAKKAAETFAPVRTVNGVVPVAGNVTLTNDDAAWIAVSAFNNSTSSLDSGNSVRYRKKSGIVFLDGKIRGGTSQNGTVASYPLFVLPAGLRPIRRMSFVVLKSDNVSSFSVGRIDIDVDGIVHGILYSNFWTNLSGISFPLG